MQVRYWLGIQLVFLANVLIQIQINLALIDEIWAILELGFVL